MEIVYSINGVPIRLNMEKVNFIKLPATKMWLDYDSEVDVLYVHFEEKPASTHSEMTDEGIILDYRENILVGMTVLEASQR